MNHSEVMPEDGLKQSEYFRYWLVTGGSGSGKSSGAIDLDRRVHSLKIFQSATTRKKRQSELKELNLLPQLRHLEHEFPTPEEMDKKITEACSSLIWKSDRKLMTIDEYFSIRESFLKGTYDKAVYMLNLGTVKSVYREGNDVMILTAFKDVITELRRLFGERAHTIVLEASLETTIDRMIKSGRTFDEIKTKIVTEKDIREYQEIGDTFISTEGFLRKQASIENNQNRLVQLIKFSRTRPYNMSPQKIHESYAASVENALAGDTRILTPGLNVLPITPEFVEKCYVEEPISPDLLRLMRVYPNLEVTDVSSSGNLKKVRISHSELEKFTEADLDAGHWREHFARLIGFYLEGKGFTPADSRSYTLRYALTDRPNQSSGITDLQLTFG